MRRAVSVAQQSHWPESEAIGSVVLDYDSRYRRRLMLDCPEIGQILLDLPQAVVLADGDGLKLTDGNWIGVKAASENLIEVKISDENHLMRIAWHLGNHHCPADLTADRIRIRQDHVIESMLEGLGCSLVRVKAKFNPVKGAYHHAVD